MNDIDLTPLAEDPGVGAALRADLGVAQAATVEGFDAAAGLSALQSAIAAEAAATTVAASSSLLTNVVAGVIAGAVLVGGAAVAWMAAGPGSDEPQVLSGPVGIVAPEASREPPAQEPASVVELSVAEQPDPAPPLDEIIIEDDIAAPGPAKAKLKTGRRSTKDVSSESLQQRLLLEAQLLADARRALSSDPARSLELTKKASKKFPKGQLVEEREALQIRALAKLGRDEEARTMAQGYLRRHSRGPHADAVRRATGL